MHQWSPSAALLRLTESASSHWALNVHPQLLFNSIVTYRIHLRWEQKVVLSCPKGTPYIECILPKGPYPPCLLMTDTALSAGYTRHIVLLTLRLRTVSESDSDWCWLHWLLLSDKETNADIHEIFKSQIWVPEFNSISSVTTGRRFDGICLRQ